MKVVKGKIKAFALVRDGEGNVMFADWFNIPKQYHDGLSSKDWAYIKSKQEEIHNGSHSP